MKKLAGEGSILGDFIVVLSLLLIVMLAVISKGRVEARAKAESDLFHAAAVFANGVMLAHEQWIDNGHEIGDEVDRLVGFRNHNFSMTLHGWPRGQGRSGVQTRLTVTACEELWNGLVGDRWQGLFLTRAQSGTGCVYEAKETNGMFKYDVNRGRVRLIIG